MPSLMPKSVDRVFLAQGRRFLVDGGDRLRVGRMEQHAVDHARDGLEVRNVKAARRPGVAGEA